VHDEFGSVRQYLEGLGGGSAVAQVRAALVA
jgi:hypothetical protein